MKHFLPIGCFVMLLIAFAFLSSRASVRRETAIKDPDAIPMLEHDWAVGEQPGPLIGLLGYPSGTYVCYGPGYCWVPIPARSLIMLAVIVVVGASYFLVSCFPGRR